MSAIEFFPVFCFVPSGVFHCAIEGVPALLVFRLIGEVGLVVFALPMRPEPGVQLPQPVVQGQPAGNDAGITGLALPEGGGLPQPGDGAIKGFDQGGDGLR
jgi:hypothetical protein